MPVPQEFSSLVYSDGTKLHPTPALQDVFTQAGYTISNVTDMRQIAAHAFDGSGGSSFQEVPLECFTKLGLTGERFYPEDQAEFCANDANYLLIPGGYMADYISQIQFAQRAEGQATPRPTFAEVIPLASMRTLDPEIENWAEMQKHSFPTSFLSHMFAPSTEFEMAKFLTYSYGYRVVCTPMNPMPTSKRGYEHWGGPFPGFQNKLKHWKRSLEILGESLKKANYVVVAQNPKQLRYTYLLKQIIPEGSQVICIGPDADTDLPRSEFVREILRILLIVERNYMLFR